MPKRSLWPDVRSKTAKGKRYWYWIKVDPGASWVRMPDPYADADGFMRKLAHLQRVSVRVDERRREGTFGALAAVYRQSKQFTDLKPNSQRTFERYLDRLVIAYGDAPLAEITPEDIQVRVLDANSDTPAAADMMLSVLRILYKFGKKRNRSLEDWTAGLDQFNDHKDREPWPPHLLAAALDHHDPLFRLAVTLALYTGQRPGDVCSMTWNAVQRDAVLVKQEKTDTKLEIPLHPDLAGALAICPRAKDHLFILQNSRGGGLTAQLFNRWCLLFNKAHGVRGFTPHGLRKNATNELFDAGCTAAQVASVTGHKSLRMLEHYGKGRSQSGLAKVAVLDRWATKTEQERENFRASGKLKR